VDVGRFEHRDVADTGAPQAGRDGDARGSTSDDQHLEVVAGGA
jgi:hypothetical protein